MFTALQMSVELFMPLIRLASFLPSHQTLPRRHGGVLRAHVCRVGPEDVLPPVHRCGQQGAEKGAESFDVPGSDDKLVSFL